MSEKRYARDFDPSTRVVENCRYMAAIGEIQNMQARIDALMMEYCPEEMTPAQIANWEKHQVQDPCCGMLPDGGWECNCGQCGT